MWEIFFLVMRNKFLNFVSLATYIAPQDLPGTLKSDNFIKNYRFVADHSFWLHFDRRKK